MKRFKKIMYRTLLVIGVLVVLFFLGGMIASPKFSGAKTILVDVPSEEVWKLIDDTKRFSESRHEVEKAEMLAPTPDGLKSWREHTPLLGTMTYEVIRQVPGKTLSIQMIHSDFGMTGNWIFNLVPQGKQTKVVLTENSSTDGLLMRSILNVLGRDANMGLLLRALEKEVKNKK